MVSRLGLFLLMVFAFGFGRAGTAEAADSPELAAADSPEVAAARGDVQRAQWRLVQYDRVEFPLELRRLEDAIRLTAAETESLERRITAYEPFTRVKYGSPVFVTLENLRLALLEAELRHRRQVDEKCLLVRLRPARRDMLALELVAAESRLATLSD